MGLYNFKPQFEADIMADRKRHTIRAKRKHPDKPGKTCHLFVGLRTKKCRLLKRRRCTRVQDVTIEIEQLTESARAVWIRIDAGEWMQADEATAFARSDGFRGLYDFADFWIKNHKADKKPFHGDLIHWESDADSEAGKQATNAVMDKLIAGYYRARKSPAPRKKKLPPHKYQRSCDCAACWKEFDKRRKKRYGLK